MLEQITLSVESALLVKAQQRAAAQNKTLENLLLTWIKSYADGASRVEQYEELMARLGYVEAGDHFSRDEMNQRR
ncbi:MAG: hypothetical protein U0X20_27140 [Caldilineaceae bacterium]